VVAAGDGADVPSQPTSGQYSVSEAYAERARRWCPEPGRRADRYQRRGPHIRLLVLSPELTGKIGARWKPTKDLVLRAASARLPGAQHRRAVRREVAVRCHDHRPCSNYTRPEVSRGDPPGLHRARRSANYSQLNPQISVATGGNRTLKPETSNSLNISVGYSPLALQDLPWIAGLDVEAAYWDVRLDQAVSALDAQLQLDRCVNGEKIFCEGILRNPQGTIFSFNNALQNLGGINVRGIDVTLAYRMPRKSFGRFRVTSQSSYLLAYEEKVPTADGFDLTDRTGTIAGTPERAFPKFKTQLAITWLFNQIELTLTTRYISSLTEQCRDLADFPGTCSHPDAADDTKSTNHLGTTVYNDLQLVWAPAFDRGLTVTAGVNNFLNREPPLCYSCSLNGFNGLTYDVPGVFGYLSATYHVQ